MKKPWQESSTELKAFKKKSPAICRGFFNNTLLFCVETVRSADSFFGNVDAKLLEGVEVGFLKND